MKKKDNRYKYTKREEYYSQEDRRKPSDYKQMPVFQLKNKRHSKSPTHHTTQHGSSHSSSSYSKSSYQSPNTINHRHSMEHEELFDDRTSLRSGFQAIRQMLNQFELNLKNEALALDERSQRLADKDIQLQEKSRKLEAYQIDLEEREAKLEQRHQDRQKQFEQQQRLLEEKRSILEHKLCTLQNIHKQMNMHMAWVEEAGGKTTTKGERCATKPPLLPNQGSSISSSMGSSLPPEPQLQGGSLDFDHHGFDLKLPEPPKPPGPFKGFHHRPSSKELRKDHDNLSITSNMLPPDLSGFRSSRHFHSGRH